MSNFLKKASGVCHSWTATKKERTKSSAELTARNEKLKAKQEVIADVFLESVDKLSSLDKDVQVKFIKDTILNLDIDGDDKLILNDACKEMVTDSVLGDINKSLKSKGKKGEISLSTENGSFKGGFILEKAGIEINNTYEKADLLIKLIKVARYQMPEQ